MAIINMVAQGSWWWGWGNIGEPLNLTVTASWLDVTITWKDNVIWTIPPTTFQKSELVRKIGSAPTSPSDWTLVVTETVIDTYETTGYIDQWLTDWETYYYRVFSYSDLWGISYCDAESVTPTTWWWTPWANTVLYLPLESDLLDHSSNGYTVTNGWTAPTQATIGYRFWQSNNQYLQTEAIPSSPYCTVSIWINKLGNDWSCVVIQPTDSNPVFYIDLVNKESSLSNRCDFEVNVWWSVTVAQWATMTQWVWYNVVWVYDGSYVKIYSNWALISTVAASWTIPSWTKKYIIWHYSSNTFDGYLSDVIIENVAWTDQKVENYYNQTKWDYNRQPWANTVAYYPLSTDFNDASGNGYDLTVSNASISTAGWVACAYYNGGRAYNSSAPVWTARTMSAWVYNITTSWDPVVIGTWANQSSYQWMFLALSNGNVQISDFYAAGVNGGTLSANTWHNIVAVNDNSSMKIYIDGALMNSTSHNQTDSSIWVSVWGKPFVNQYNNDCTGYVSEAIIEWVAWTDQEVSDYYDLTKWNYWIS